MPKGYWIALVDVRDMDGYRNSYVAGLAEVFRKFGGRYLTRGGATETVEGHAKSRVVIIEFPSYDQAVACYKSPEYSKLIPHRKANAEADLIVTEGYDGPQP